MESDREQAVFEAGIKLGALYHQWVGTPISRASVFTGMVLALQVADSSASIFNEPLYIGTVVGFSLVKELGRC